MDVIPPLPPSLAPRLETSDRALRDASGASGPFWIPPAGVVRPRAEDEVAELLAWADRHGVRLIPRGAGSGMPAGNVGPHLLLDLMALGSKVSVAPGDFTLTGTASVRAAEAADLAAAAGGSLPALPSSARWCTLGGIVAANASGARSLRFGDTRAQLRALRWVEADGTVAWSSRSVTEGDARGLPPRSGADDGFRERWRLLHEQERARFGDRLPWPRVPKNSSGYALDAWLPSGDPIDLLCGSEGTLGVVTEVTLRLRPEDEKRWVGVIGLPTLAHLADGSRVARRVGANACEYFGTALVELGGLGRDPRLVSLASEGGLLLIEIGGPSDDVERDAGLVRGWARDAGGIVEAETPGERAALWALRHDASPRIMREVGRGRRSIQFIEDCVVPPERLPAFVEELEEILRAAGFPAVIFGHAGQGNLHVNPLVDPSLDGWRETVLEVLERVVDLVARLGGTMSGEHGDGRLRAHWLHRIFDPEVVASFRRIRDGLDPGGILNPGVILPEPGSDPLHGLGEAPDFLAGSQGPEGHG